MTQENTSKRQCVFVLGMHRSGTSATAGVLNILGVDFGDNLLPLHPDNPKGYFEDRTIMDLNDYILMTLRSSWDDDRPLPVNWHTKKEIAQLKTALKERIDAHCASEGLHGIKDPRICVLLPLYLDIVHELRIEPLFVVMLRKDIEVVRSLQKRDNFSVIKAQNLFEKYTADIAAHTKKEKSVYVDFDDLLHNPEETIEKIRNGLGLTICAYEEKREEIVNFMDPTLKHHTLSYTSFLREIDEDLQKKEDIIAQLQALLSQQEQERLLLSKEILALKGNTLVRWARRIENPIINSLHRCPPMYRAARKIIGVIRRATALPRAMNKFAAYKKVYQMKVAVFVHLFYEDLWDELKQFIDKIPVSVDLFVNLVEGHHSTAVHARIQTDYPSAVITVSENKGYDLGGLITSLRKADLGEYDLICKIHSKKSKHSDIGTMWRRALLTSILGSQERVIRILSTFAKNRRVGMVGCKNFLCDEMGANVLQYHALCDTLGIRKKNRAVKFFAGTMFWCRPEILKRIHDLHLDLDDFECPPELKKLSIPDGQLAHAMERIFGAVVRDFGYTIVGFPPLQHYAYSPKKFPWVMQEQDGNVLTGNANDIQWEHDDTSIPGASETASLPVAKRPDTQPAILVVDHQLPLYDQESGARRMMHLLNIFKSLGLRVMFMPADNRGAEPYLSELENSGIDVLINRNTTMEEFSEILQQKARSAGVAWICRPHLFKRYYSVLKKANPEMKFVYDTIDLHHVRLWGGVQFAANMREKVVAARSALHMKNLEIACAKKADVVVAISEDECLKLQEFGILNALTIPNILKYKGHSAAFAERSGLLFIGNYLHEPNIVAVQWLCTKIMPVVWEKFPDVRVTLLGANPSEEVQLLAQDKRIAVPGYVHNVAPYFYSHKIFVAPIRYGAGMKGKVGQSLEYGLPVITTPCGAEGMNLTHEKHVLIAGNTEMFAQNILELCTNEHLWNALSENSEDALQTFCPQAVAHTVSELLETYCNPDARIPRAQTNMEHHDTVEKKPVPSHVP